MVAEDLKKSLDEFFSWKARPMFQVGFWFIVGIVVAFLWWN